MTWFACVPVAGTSVVWLLLPGLLVTYGFGLRGVAAWSTAPIVTIAELSALAVFAARLGRPWSVPLVVLGCAALAAVTAVVGFALRRRAPARVTDPRSVTVAAVLGLVPAVLLGAVTIARGFGRPDGLSETFDAVFHYNAVAYIVDTRQASSLTIGTLGTPGLPGTFYPAAWHDLTSLVVLSTRASIPVAANMVSAMVAIVAWPLSCLLLVRQLAGRSAAAMAVTGVLAIGFNAFPWGLLSWGVLWPNLLGMSIAPAGLAIVLSACGLAREDAIGRGRAWLLLPVLALAATLAHPNVVFSLVVLAVFPVGTAVLRRALRLRRAGRTLRGVAEVLATVAVLAAGWWWAATTPALAPVRTFYWPPIATPRHALRQVLVNSTNYHPSLWLLSALVLLGCLPCLRRAELRWLVAGQVLSGGCYVLTAAVNRPATQAITGYWYNDSNRLAAMIPITAVPLAVAAVLLLATVIRRVLPAGSPTAIAVGLVVVFLAVTGGGYLRSHQAVLAEFYTYPLTHPDVRLVDAAERDFFARTRARIPADAVVADDPWDGSALLWALADRRTLFPHLGIATSAEQNYLAAHLADAATDPAVCPAARALHVGFLLVGNGTFWPTFPPRNAYSGLADPGARPGFQLLDADGPMKLYRLTAC